MLRIFFFLLATDNCTMAFLLKDYFDHHHQSSSLLLSFHGYCFTTGIQHHKQHQNLRTTTSTATTIIAHSQEQQQREQREKKINQLFMDILYLQYSTIFLGMFQSNFVRLIHYLRYNATSYHYTTTNNNNSNNNHHHDHYNTIDPILLSYSLLEDDPLKFDIWNVYA
jgi:hypothetical protein